MNEELKKSKKLEQQLRRESQGTDLSSAFASYTQLEKQNTLSAIQTVSTTVEYEDMLAHGYKGEQPLNAPETEQKVAVHKQAEAEDASLSWSQKRKLKSRQADSLKQARGAGVQNATALTVPLAIAMAEGAFAADEHMQKLTPDERGELSQKRPDETLFDRHYEKKSSNPYDITKMSCRLAELNEVAARYETYKNNLAAGSVQPDPEFEVRCESQIRLQRALSRAMDALRNANAVPLRKTQLTDVELKGDRNIVLKSCISAYEHDAANFDTVIEETRRELFERKLREDAARVPKNDADEKELGFSFRQHPAQLDELRALIDAPENSAFVDQNVSAIRTVLNEYIRVQHTLDDRRAGLAIAEQGGETFRKIRIEETDDVFRLEGLADAYASTLRSLATGAPLEEFCDVLLSNRFGIVTENRMQSEAKYTDINADEKAIEQRRQVLAARAQTTNTINRYLYSLPKEQRNPKMDVRIVSGLCRGWKTDSDDNPLTDEDRQTMERETKWVRDLYGRTDDVPRTDKAEEQARLASNRQIEDARHAVIDQYLDRYINMSVSSDIFEPAYIRAHYNELAEMGQVMLLLDNFEAGDPAYFKSLPAERKAQIDAASKRAVGVAPYLKHLMAVETGLEENGNFSAEYGRESYKQIAAMLKPQAEEALSLHKTRMREAHFDATTDGFSMEEGDSLSKLFISMSPTHFADKIKARLAKGLPCDDLGQICECMHGKTLGEYYDELINPQYSAEEIERLRDSGFGGASVNFPGLDFGSDDLGTVYDTVKLIAGGGADAAAYGADEETAAHVSTLLERFRDISFENARMKMTYCSTDEFTVPLLRALRSIEASKVDVPTLHASMRIYQQLSAKASTDLYHEVLESDRQLRGGPFLDIIEYLSEKNISFRADQRAALADYMNDPGQTPAIDVEKALELNGQPLRVLGAEAGDVVTEQHIAAKRKQLGKNFPAWAQQLAEKVAAANATYTTMQKYHKISEDYFFALQRQGRANGAMVDAKIKLDKKDLSETERAALQADYEEKKRAYEASDPKLGNPVFSKIHSKEHFMQYEIMQKDTACGMRYDAQVQELRDMMQ